MTGSRWRLIKKLGLVEFKQGNLAFDDMKRVLHTVNELVEASNRQDRAISFLLHEQYGSDIHKALPEDFDYWMELRDGQR